MFTGLSSFSGSLGSKKKKKKHHNMCISLNNWPRMTWPTLIDLNPTKYNQGLRYYPFIVNLDRCNGSCNFLDDPSGRICVPNKADDINLNVFNMITRTNESKTFLP